LYPESLTPTLLNGKKKKIDIGNFQSTNKKIRKKLIETWLVSSIRREDKLREIEKHETSEHQKDINRRLNFIHKVEKKPKQNFINRNPGIVPRIYG
jgi:hypothetical protein